MLKNKICIFVLISFLSSGYSLFSHENCDDGNTFILKGNINELRKSWNRLLSKKQYSSRNFLSQVNKFKNKHGIPIYSYKEKNLPKDYIEYTEPPCGPQLITFEKYLNKSQKLNLDSVHEVDNKGISINKWNIPVNGTIVGVSGNSLFVDYMMANLCDYKVKTGKFALEIFTNGNIKIVEKNNSDIFLIKKDFNCKNVKLYQKSDYRVCEIFSDLKNLRERRLIFNGPCT